MNDEEQPSVARGESSNKLLIGSIALTLLLICVLYIGWEAARYRGFFARASEWQFNQFGQWLPAFTLIVFVLIPLLIIALVAKIFIFRRDEKNAAVTDKFQLWLMQARKFRVIASGVSVAMLIGALLALVIGILIAQGGHPARIVEPGGGAVAGRGKEQVIVGHVDRRLETMLAFDLLFIRRGVRYAPVFEPGQPNTIRYITELPADDTNPNDPARHESTVFSGKVPGPVIVLYRSLGYRVDSDVRLIDGSRTTIQWPFYLIAIHLAIGALIAFVIACIQARRIRRGEELATKTFMEDEALPAV